MAWEYSDKVRELFINALYGKSSSYFGNIVNSDGEGIYGSIECGDAIKFYIKVKKDERNPFNDKLIKVKYETFGCTSAIASSEALCHIIMKNKMTPIDALNITNSDIIDFLEGMPEEKKHCSVMGSEVLKAAIFDWANKRNVDLKLLKKEITQKFACGCHSIFENELTHTLEHREFHSLNSLIDYTKAGSACGKCIESEGKVYHLFKTRLLKNKQNTLNPLNSFDKSKIKEIISEIVPPILAKRNGIIELISIKNSVIYIKLTKLNPDMEFEQVKMGNTIKSFIKESLKKEIKLIDIA